MPETPREELRNALRLDRTNPLRQREAANLDHFGSGLKTAIDLISP